MLHTQNLHYQINGKQILKGVSLKVAPGEFVGIIGPNGSGKSTLLKNVCKLLRPTSGFITLNGQDIQTISNRQMAQQMAVVSQENEAVFDFSVEEVLQMGRYPRKGPLEPANQQDDNAITDALRLLEMSDFRQRSFLSLSGGEKQRILIGRALVQQTDLIVLDEPTNHLDIGSQLKILGMLRRSGKTILAALHDLSMAARYCDRIYVLLEGTVLKEGTPHQVITDQLIHQLYHVTGQVFWRNSTLFIEYS